MIRIPKLHADTHRGRLFVSFHRRVLSKLGRLLGDGKRTGGVLFGYIDQTGDRMVVTEAFIPKDSVDDGHVLEQGKGGVVERAMELTGRRLKRFRLGSFFINPGVSPVLSPTSERTMADFVKVNRVEEIYLHVGGNEDAPEWSVHLFILAEESTPDDFGYVKHEMIVGRSDDGATVDPRNWTVAPVINGMSVSF